MVDKFRPLSLSAVVVIALLSSGCVATIPLLADKPPPVTAHENVNIYQIDFGAVISVPNLNLFDSGQHTLKQEAEQLLRSLSNTLNNKTGSRILIEVSSENAGRPQSATVLSERRANSIRRDLVSRGTPLVRITTVSSNSRSLFSMPEGTGNNQGDRTLIVLVGEATENLTTDGSIFKDVGNQTNAAAISVRVAIDNTTILARKYNPPLRSRSVGDVTQCPSGTGPSMIVIDASSIAPGSPIATGTEIQHLVQTQLCMRAGIKRSIEQAVSVLQNGSTVFTSPKFVHNGMYRSRQQFISTLSIPKGAPAGEYEVESLIVLDGHLFKQSTPFEVK